MDYETVAADVFGRSLTGIGLNLIVHDVEATTDFLTNVFAMSAFRVSADFAILRYGDQLFQLHGDQTYHSNPVLSLLPENGARGGGAEIRLYDTDPDEAARRASAHSCGSSLLIAPADHMHGLRECTILCSDGYAWVPSRPLSAEEVSALKTERAAAD